MSITITAIDCLHGHPAAGVLVQLARRNDHGWREPSKGCTDDTGNVGSWDPEPKLERGVYRVELDLDGYFATLGIAPFMPTAVASFRVLDSSEPCRITLLVTPYTTIAYRSP